MRRLCALGLFLALLHVSSCLLIGAFNIQKFGDKKSQDADVMKIISTIVHRYDIILIQEVLDSDQKVIQRLMNEVNAVSPQYSFITSAPLGPTVYKERYLYLYKQSTVSVVTSFQYTDMTKFNRPPFAVKFASITTAVEYVLIPQHTRPKSAVAEVDALYDVAKDVLTLMGTNNVMLLGDFNAGSCYIPKAKWPLIRLFTDKSYHWLIANSVDTTVSRSGNAYDRIVVTTTLNSRVVTGSADVFNFQAQYGLTLAQTKAVSDHFPVEVQLS
ncbi:hypothetical protein PBY51_008375 [Eleginops maclovinus]|uniref:Deoxyribonuclease n=1 Tax=Eleginops maclovinus TaxID=56733 RepID=A0AAN7X745_ELEMC|nr:hypothetical protein PBY51_008375 [Eleginops maclovinus]